MEIPKKLNDEDIAGLWKTDMLKGLTWFVQSYHAETPGLEEPRYYIAPSWS